MRLSYFLLHLENFGIAKRAVCPISPNTNSVPIILRRFANESHLTHVIHHR